MSERYHLDELRGAFTQPGDPPPPGSCPGAPAIWDAAHGLLPARQLRDVVDHLASCSACAEAWRIALLLEPAAEGEDAPQKLARWPRARLYGGMAAAAAALFAVVLGVRGLGGGPAPEAMARRGIAVEQQRATRWLTKSDTLLPRQRAEIRWSGPPQSTYDLDVSLVDERTEAIRSPPIAAARGLAANQMILPERDLIGLPAGAHLQAALTTHLPDGRSETIFRDFHLP